MNAVFVKDALRRRHPPNAWIYLTELRTRTGYSHQLGEVLDNERYIDAFAIHLWPSKGYERIAYEIKVSKSDLLAELADPAKRAQAYLLAHRFYFAVPEELAQLDTRYTEDRFTRRSRTRKSTIWEGLKGAGVIAVSDTGHSRIVWEAAKRSAWPMPETFLVSMLRTLRRDVEAGVQVPQLITPPPGAA